MALKRLCSYPGCVRFAVEGTSRCEKHQLEKRPFIGGWMTDAQKAFYNSQRWRKLKAELLEENPVCQICGKNPAEECHHQYPIGYDFHNTEDFFNSDNIICLCRECHQAVTRQRINEVKKRNKERK